VTRLDKQHASQTLIKFLHIFILFQLSAPFTHATGKNIPQSWNENVSHAAPNTTIYHSRVVDLVRRESRKVQTKTENENARELRDCMK